MAREIPEFPDIMNDPTVIHSQIKIINHVHTLSTMLKEAYEQIYDYEQQHKRTVYAMERIRAINQHMIKELIADKNKTIDELRLLIPAAADTIPVQPPHTS